jgi:hypothetical protein
MGEIQTALLRNSVPISVATAGQLLEFVVGEKVRIFERPIFHAVSPERLTGVDCQLASSSGAAVRVVGTIASHASITGGHVSQGSAFVRVIRGGDRRLPWWHYLARPGAVETIGKAGREQLAAGFLSGRTGARLLDLSAVAGRALDAVQHDARLDQRPPFKTQRTRLRWMMSDVGKGAEPVIYRVDGIVRILRLPCRDMTPAATVALCEDLALHDWLLTTLISLVGRAPIGSGDRMTIVDKLRPALDYLLHLWMPGARIDPAHRDLWDAMERQPGFSRQWQSIVGRIRDQLALAAVSFSLS